MHIFHVTFTDPCCKTVFLTSSKTAKWYNSSADKDTKERDTNPRMGEYWHWYKDTREDRPGHIYYRLLEDDTVYFLFRWKWGRKAGQWAVNDISIILLKSQKYNLN